MVEHCKLDFAIGYVFEEDDTPTPEPIEGMPLDGMPLSSARESSFGDTNEEVKDFAKSLLDS